MVIYFKTNKLQKICSTKVESTKQLGKKGGIKLQQRMMELSAAPNLSDMSRLPPPRCHELKGGKKGQFSVDLAHPYRLLFIVANKPIPKNPDGGFDWACIDEIEIVGIKDTH